MRGADRVFHLAAQVAVTTSLLDPRGGPRGQCPRDPERPGGGTAPDASLPRSCSPRRTRSTVACRTWSCDWAAGAMSPSIATCAPTASPSASRWTFCSPYGCSKGAADQYVLDYAHSFGLRACVLRMSCIYGPHQQGTEDQGWVAHFLISALHGRADHHLRRRAPGPRSALRAGPAGRPAGRLGQRRALVAARSTSAAGCTTRPAYRRSSR